MKNIFSILFIIAGLGSCITKTDKADKDSFNGMAFPNFQEHNNGLANFPQKKDTLIITVEFSDCGEWGGHKEFIKLFRNSENRLIGELKVDSISCKNIKDYENYSDLDDNSRKIVQTIVKELDVEDEKLVNLFIHRILELKLNYELQIAEEGKEEIIPIFIDSGTVIEIRNSNSTFLIDYFNMDESANTWYGKISKEIFRLKI
jgi:hypothetical protein